MLVQHKSRPRITGWSKLFLDYIVAHGGGNLHVLTEQELLAAVLAAGRRVNADWRGVVANAMRCIGWKLHKSDRCYRRASRVAAPVVAPVEPRPLGPEVYISRRKPVLRRAAGGAS